MHLKHSRSALYTATNFSLLLVVQNTRRLSGDESCITYRKKEDIQVEGEHNGKNKSFTGKEIREGDGIKTTEIHYMHVRNHDFLLWAPH